MPRNCLTDQTARKSTARKTPRSRTPLAPIHRDDSRNIFGNAADRLARVVERKSIYNGPVGLGLGKGGMKRIKKSIKVLPTREQIEKGAKVEKSSIPLIAFERAVKQILNSIVGEGKYRLQVKALLLLREIAESHLIKFFYVCNMFVIHTSRVTLMPKDIDLYYKVKMQAEINHQKEAMDCQGNRHDSTTV